MAINDSCPVPGGTCSAPGTQMVGGMCRKHYRRLKKYGDPLAGPTGRGEPAAFLDLAAAYVGAGCLEWPYGKLSGYGVIAGQPEGTTLAHRIVLIRTVGPPPEPEMEACHLPVACHNPGCVNPAHLYWGTKEDNQADRRLDGTAPIGERARTAKLTAAEVDAIRASAAPGVELARLYGVDDSTISNIRKRKTWAHIP